MAEKLTPQQHNAVYNRGGSILVSAAAGSGKTKVLVDRILSYLTDHDDPAHIDEFLIITYTKAAASELRGKIAAKLSERIAENPGNKHLQRQMQRLYLTKISTVHAFCTDILREYAYKLNIPSDFRMAEETEAQQLQVKVLEQVLDAAYSNIEKNPDLQAFVDTQGIGRDDRQLPAIIIKVYNSSRCHLNPQEWLQSCLASTCYQDMTDVGQTKWGKYLIEDLHVYLDLHLQALENAQKLLLNVDGMDKVDALLSDDISRLVELRACETWEQIHTYGSVPWSNFPRSYSDKELAERIKAVRGKCKDDIKSKLSSFVNSSQQVFMDLEHTGASARGLIGLVNQFAEQYDNLKKQLRVMDFADLEHKTLELLLGKNRTYATTTAKEISQRFREVMVDEYQDSNEVQDAIFRVLTQERNNAFMVGDVKQSIYQFRLADPGIFLDKYKNYKDVETARESEPRKIILSHNFRSAGQVIGAVNDVFTNCMSEAVGGLIYGEDEMLREGIPHAILNEPEIELYGIEADGDTYGDESVFVAERICQLLDGKHFVRCDEGFRPITADDIVILLRSPNSVGAEFICALQDRGIRCTMGGSADLLQTEEVSVLWALLQTISNPLQDIPLSATLISRLFCFTADELAEIRQQHRGSVFYRSLCASNLPKAVAFVELLGDLRKQARLSSVSQLIEYVFIKTGMDSIYASLADGNERIANLQAFCQFATSVENAGRKDLESFLEQLAALAEKGMVVTSDKKPANCVTIMSIHKSKGLEFPVVFLSALSRRFNQKSATEQVLCDPEYGIGLSYVDTVKRIRYPSVAKKAISNKIKADSVSEELRVLYVAMTRAKDRLIMTYASDSLEKTLTDIALRTDLSGRLLMTANVSSPGRWILQAAMMRTEAGEFHALGGHPDCCAVSDSPWLIRRVTVSYKDESIAEQPMEQQVSDSCAINKIQKFLGYQYPYEAASRMPSKLTATQLKGRVKDQEISENAKQSFHRSQSYRKPSFVAQPKDAKKFGTAIHLLLQHLDFSKCATLQGVESEIARVVAEGFVSADVIKDISAQKLLSFFSSEVGKRMLRSEKIIKEFKFSILCRTEEYEPGLVGEDVLLQGVVDCAFFDADGITLIDFKTDHVRNENLEAVAQGYYSQVRAYSSSLSRIFNLPIKNAYLYFLELNCFVPVL